MAAVTRVPQEVWSNIFKNMVAAWEEEGGNSSSWEEGCWDRLWEGIRAVNSVSRSWRKAALNTPHLWTHLWHGAQYTAENLPYDYKLCLRHSAGFSSLPLFVMAESLPYFFELMREIAEWNALPRVKTISIGDSIDQLPPSGPFPECTNLEELSLSLGETMAPREELILLRRYRTIHTLRIDRTDFPYTANDNVVDFVEFPHLKSLEVVQQDDGGIIDTFAWLSAPALENLTIVRGDSRYYLQPLPAASIHMHGTWDSLPELRELTFGGGTLVEDMLDVMGRAPKLERLNLRRLEGEGHNAESDNYDALFDALASPESRNDSPGTSTQEERSARSQEDVWLVPSLRMVKCHRTPITLLAIRRMVEGRLGKVKPVEAIGLSTEYFGTSGTTEMTLLKEVVVVFTWDPPRFRGDFVLQGRQDSQDSETSQGSAA